MFSDKTPEGFLDGFWSDLFWSTKEWWGATFFQAEGFLIWDNFCYLVFLLLLFFGSMLQKKAG